MTIATQPFGRSGHMSTRTIFGAASLGSVTQEEADRTLEVLLQYGVNHIDVASSYGDAELRIAQISTWRPRPMHVRRKRRKRSCTVPWSACASTM